MEYSKEHIFNSTKIIVKVVYVKPKIISDDIDPRDSYLLAKKEIKIEDISNEYQFYRTFINKIYTLDSTFTKKIKDEIIRQHQHGLTFSIGDNMYYNNIVKYKNRFQFESTDILPIVVNEDISNRILKFFGNYSLLYSKDKMLISNIKINTTDNYDDINIVVIVNIDSTKSKDKIGGYIATYDSSHDFFYRNCVLYSSNINKLCKYLNNYNIDLNRCTFYEYNLNRMLYFFVFVKKFF